MSNLTAKEITNWYLYGQATTPANLADESLIRSPGVTATTTQDVAAFMTTGAGRFATGYQFDLIKWFLDPVPFGYQRPYVPPGEYSADALAQLLGLTNSPLVIRQRQFDDGAGDYGERTYIWNTGSFVIKSSARFIVNADLTREIRDFAVEPNGRENFDFVSNDSIASLIGNDVLQRDLDPSNIGRKVFIEFTGGAQTRTYTEQSYLAEKALYDSWSSPSLPSLLSAIRTVEDGLWSDGTVKFLDGSKPIIYGTLEADSLSWLLLNNHRYLGDHVQNGVVIIAGTGQDDLRGGANDDRLEGDENDDTIAGNKGNDFIDGGWKDHLDPATDGTDTAEYVDSPGRVLIDFIGQDPARLRDRLIDVADDGYGTQDTLHSIEKIKLSGKGDTVKVSADNDKSLGGLKEIDAGSQGSGQRDVLELDGFGAGIKFNKELRNYGDTSPIALTS